MPRLFPYEQQTNAPRANPRTLDFGSGAGAAAVGAALENVADDQARLQAFARQKEEERAAVWANEQVMGVRSRWVEELPKRQQAASETAEGFALTTLTDFDKQADEVIEQAPTQASRAWLKDRLGHVRLALQQDALGFEALRGAEYKVSGLERSTDQAQLAAEFRPEDFPVLAAEQLAAIDASGLNAEVQAKLIQDGQQKLASAAVQGMIRSDPRRALTLLNEEPIRAQDGSPALRNPDGSVSTMLTATVEDERLNGGRPTNIPTVWDGKALPEQDAIGKAIGSGRSFPAFQSVDEAVAAAKDASAKKGRSIGPERLAVNALNFERRQMLRNAAEAEINRRESEAKANLTEVRQALSDQLTDIKVAATNGMTITNVPSRPALVAAFGEQEGNQRYTQALAFAALSPKVSALYQAPIGEVVETVQSFKPTQVEGAAEQFAMLGIVQQKAASILKEREEDAGGYLASYSPSVRQAWTAFQQAEGESTDAAAADYLRAVRAEKERLGIQSTDVLPAAYADALVSSLTKPQGAETLAASMAGEAERWGAAWPQVYRQVAKKLPDAALVIGSGIPKRAADTLALMSSKTPDELKTLIPAGQSMNDIETDVTADLADLISTFGPEGATVLTAVRNSTIKTAIGYMAGGTSYRDAITQAASDIANDRYSFQQFRDQAYRVPAELDPDLVDEGATYFLANYAQPSGTVQVPAGTAEDVILRQATENIRLTGYWRTAPDESGLRLYVGNAVVPGAGGKPVQLTWSDLEDLARKSAAENYENARQQAAERGERGQIPGLR